MKKYDLIILQFVEDKLIASFYREEYGECKEIIDLIESYKKAM